RVLGGLVESFIYVFEIGGIDGFHADEDPFAAGLRDQVNQFFIPQQVGADLRHPVNLRLCRDDVFQQRFGALNVDGEIIIDEEDCDLAFFFTGTGFQQQQFVDHALVAAKADRVTEKSGDGAEFAAVRTASSRLDRDYPKGPPAFAYAVEKWGDDFRQQIELFQVNRIPRNGGIVFERRLFVFAICIYRRIDVFKLSGYGVVDHLRPGFIRFA